MNWTENDTLVDGKRIHYYRIGATGKPVLFLIHGLTDTGLCWQPIAEELAGDYDIVLPDARGHGKSERIAPGEKIDLIANLAGVIANLGLGGVIAGGHSMGAGEAALLCARYPELVRAVFLEDPPWRYPQAPDPGVDANMKDNPISKFVAGLQGKSLDELAAQCHLDHPTWPDIIARRWSEGKQQIDPNFFTAEKDFIGDWPQAAAAIACPALLITADPQLGAIINEQTARMASAANPRLRVAHIAGAGHHIRFAKHVEYMEVVRAFLAQVA